jgi:hypothetical protein
MNATAEMIEEGRQVPSESMNIESGTVALLAKADIDAQIATAHRYPRSIKRFRDECLQMVTLTEAVAGECIYALPRREKDKATGQWVTKALEGPSARFAEVILSAWGNSRAGARVIDIGAEFVTSQGVCHDLERNVAITFEVQRRITDSQNRRFSADMIGVTANAASSIALRNAILKVVPKAFWSEMYAAARKVVAGDVRSLANRRGEMIKAFAAFAVTQEQILGKLGRAGIQDVTIDDMVILHGFLTAIKDGDGSPESIFADDPAQTSANTAQAAASMRKTPPAAAPAAQSNEKQPAPQAAPNVDQATGEITASATPAPEHHAGDEQPAVQGIIGAIKRRVATLHLHEATVAKHHGLENLDAMSVGMAHTINKQLRDDPMVYAAEGDGKPF